MGARRHGQEGALAPSGNVEKCFCALVVTAKRLVDELFMHFFTICRWLLETSTPDPHWGSIPRPRWGLLSPGGLLSPDP